MDNGLRSKHRHHDRPSRASFDRGCCLALAFVNAAWPWPFRCAEIIDQGITGTVRAIVHTGLAFNPSAQEAAHQETA
jgi:hypothetical protein